MVTAFDLGSCQWSSFWICHAIIHLSLRTSPNYFLSFAMLVVSWQSWKLSSNSLVSFSFSFGHWRTDPLFLNLRSSEIHLFYNLGDFYWHFLEILWLFIFLFLYLWFSIKISWKLNWKSYENRKPEKEKE